MTLRTLLLTGGMGAAIVLILLVLASAPQPAPAAAPPAERPHKADRLPARRLVEPPMPPEPQALPNTAPAPAPVVLAAVRPPLAHDNICTRHHGWKVISGRSWHCAYAR
jgi:hypothetical protein